VKALVLGSGALLGVLDSGSKCTISGWWITSN
jgi:hypothetical protein